MTDDRDALNLNIVIAHDSNWLERLLCRELNEHLLPRQYRIEQIVPTDAELVDFEKRRPFLPIGRLSSVGADPVSYALEIRARWILEVHGNADLVCCYSSGMSKDSGCHAVEVLLLGSNLWKGGKDIHSFPSRFSMPYLGDLGRPTREQSLEMVSTALRATVRGWWAHTVRTAMLEKKEQFAA